MKNQLNFRKWNVSKLGISIMVLSLILTGCEEDDISGVPETNNMGEVTVQFQTVAATPGNGRPALPPDQSENTLTIEGSNGTLFITDIQFVVDDFELENEGPGDDNDYNEFESGIFFVDLPLDGNPLDLATSEIEEGTYNSLDFEIENLDIDEEEDAAEEEEKAALLAAIRTEFSDWPQAASMVISGSFAPTGGEEVEFLAYADAEVEIENNLTPPLEIGSSTTAQLSVNINPVNWFEQNDGTVMDLSAFDYATTNQLLEFEVELENGIVSVETEED